MPAFPFVLVVLGVILSTAGVLLMVGSLVSARRRGQEIGVRFWAPSSMFMAGELSRNRRGFVLSVLGILLLCVAMYVLWPG